VRSDVVTSSASCNCGHGLVGDGRHIAKHDFGTVRVQFLESCIKHSKVNPSGTTTQRCLGCQHGRTGHTPGSAHNTNVTKAAFVRVVRANHVRR
jgi:hypothetical protein